MTNKKNKNHNLNLIAVNLSLDEVKTEAVWDNSKNTILNVIGSYSEERWQKGKKNEEGYFTLRAFESPKLLTASPEGLELKGNKELNHYSQLSHKRAGWNKRVGRAELFSYYMKKCE